MINTYYRLHPDGNRIEVTNDGKMILKFSIPTLDNQIKIMDIKHDCVPIVDKDAHIEETEKGEVFD